MIGDICRNRHGGNAESEAANARVDKEGDRARILDYVRSVLRGVTLDEASQHFRVAPNRISGRFTELKARGLIITTNERRLTRTGSSAMVYKARL